MRVAVEEAVCEDHLEPEHRHLLDQRLALGHRHGLQVDVGDLCALDQLRRQDPSARVRPHHPGDDDPSVAGEGAAQGLGVARLRAVVHLGAQRPRELVDELDRVDEQAFPTDLGETLRELSEQVKVGGHQRLRLRALHLHRHRAAVGQDRAVHLSDARRRHGHRIEALKSLCDGEAELRLDRLLDLRQWERRHGVLELGQFRDDVLGHDVGTGREHLPELDERRPELLEHQP